MIETKVEPALTPYDWESDPVQLKGAVPYDQETAHRPVMSSSDFPYDWSGGEVSEGLRTETTPLVRVIGSSQGGYIEYSGAEVMQRFPAESKKVENNGLNVPHESHPAELVDVVGIDNSQTVESEAANRGIFLSNIGRYLGRLTKKKYRNPSNVDTISTEVSEERDKVLFQAPELPQLPRVPHARILYNLAEGWSGEAIAARATGPKADASWIGDHEYTDTVNHSSRFERLKSFIDIGNRIDTAKVKKAGRVIMATVVAAASFVQPIESNETSNVEILKPKTAAIYDYDRPETPRSEVKTATELSESDRTISLRLEDGPTHVILRHLEKAHGVDADAFTPEELQALVPLSEKLIRDNPGSFFKEGKSANIVWNPEYQQFWFDGQHEDLGVEISDKIAAKIAGEFYAGNITGQASRDDLRSTISLPSDSTLAA